MNTEPALLPEAPPPARRRLAGRALDVLAVLVIGFAIWKLFLAPRFFVRSQAAVSAPLVAIPMMGGGRFDLAGARGHVVFLDFWASWCEPCKLSIPLIERFKQSHPGVTVISVDAGEPTAVASRYALGQKMRRVAFDPEMTVTHAFGVEVFPTMVVIDADGKERAKWVGFNPLIESAMANAVKSFGG